MSNRFPLAVGEWYHCFTRGVDKRRTFQSAPDYRRFIETLYLANSDTPIHRSDLHLLSHAEILSKPRGEQIVRLGAYCLMPNHFHLLMQEVVEGGIVRFMQKVGTAYTMYFNIKNQRVGQLFVGPFRSKYIDDDAYIRRVAQYIHLNPAELFNPAWKSGEVRNIKMLEKQVRGYSYSSLPDYIGPDRPERGLIDNEAFELLSDELPPLKKVMTDAVEYYQEIGLG